MTIQVSLQSSVGRFELSVDPALSLRDVKRAFRKEYTDLADVNMSAFVLSYKGVFLTDDAVQLKACGVEDGAVLFLIRRRTVPSLNPQEAE